MIRILAINGSYRRGKTIDTLMAQALEGARRAHSDVTAETVFLKDRHIEYCRNCMTCKAREASDGYVTCVIRDDMDELLPKMAAADAFLFGTPVNIGSATAVMKAFLERLCWTFARPKPTGLFAGMPVPRTSRQRAAAIIVSAGLTPTLLHGFFDRATPLIREVCKISLNAQVVAKMFAGSVQKRGVSPYLEPAFVLGRKLVRKRIAQA